AEKSSAAQSVAAQSVAARTESFMMNPSSAVNSIFLVQSIHPRLPAGGGHVLKGSEGVAGGKLEQGGVTVFQNCPEPVLVSTVFIRKLGALDLPQACRGAEVLCQLGPGILLGLLRVGAALPRIKEIAEQLTGHRVHAQPHLGGTLEERVF